ncbi:MAG TPA: hypothetical protein VEG30_12995 [Terriglobales bacterium]|nr:hypothetical protein [Terriglobales bacterium]
MGPVKGLNLALTLLALLSAFAVRGLTQEPASEQAPATKLDSPLTVDQVVDRLERKNAERKQEMARLEGRRIYRLVYRGFPGDREAQMQVRCVYQNPDDKQFFIQQSSGSKVILDKVFQKLLEGEQEATQPQNEQRSILSRDNYSFTLVAYEQGPEGTTYVLQVEPKSKNRFLYVGRIWVDGDDFAVKKIRAEPAKNPSFWTKKNEIEHEYMKVGDFWVPVRNRSVSSTRLGGTATLTIEYSDYEIKSKQGETASSDRPSTASAKRMHGEEQ